MTKSQLKSFSFVGLLIAGWVAAFYVLPPLVGNYGFWGEFFATSTFVKFAIYFVVMAHFTISAMSIAFHRSHTHQAVKLHRSVDYLMQTWLWAFTSMSKLDWVSVHIYHHAHSDTPNDPHSPAQKGLASVFFLGVRDYSQAKSWPDVLKIRARIPTTAFERYLDRHLFQGPILLTTSLMVAFGPLYGSILGVLNFLISPLFAVGGVNALAHAIGYKNYDSKDESRNLGFLAFLNWIIAGELDHNNHHRFPKSPSFAHRWFEFDIGWVYIRAMRLVGLATVTGTIPEYEKHALKNTRSSSLGEKMATGVATGVAGVVRDQAPASL